MYLLEIQNNNHLTFEVNGELLEKAIEQEYITLDTKLKKVDWFRVESYKFLDYIYFWFDGNINFKVWSDYYEIDFIDNMSIDNFTIEEYRRQVLAFEKVINKTYRYN